MLVKNHLFSGLQRPTARIGDCAGKTVAGARLCVLSCCCSPISVADMGFCQAMLIGNGQALPAAENQMKIIWNLGSLVNCLIDDFKLLGEAEDLAMRIPCCDFQHLGQVLHIRNISADMETKKATTHNSRFHFSPVLRWVAIQNIEIALICRSDTWPQPFDFLGIAFRLTVAGSTGNYRRERHAWNFSHLDIPVGDRNLHCRHLFLMYLCIYFRQAERRWAITSTVQPLPSILYACVSDTGNSYHSGTV